MKRLRWLIHQKKKKPEELLTAWQTLKAKIVKLKLAPADRSICEDLANIPLQLTNANDDQVRAVYDKLLDFAPTNGLVVSYHQTTWRLVGIIWDLRGLGPRVEEVD